MKRTYNRFNYFLYSILILLTVYRDSFLVIILGEFGKNISMIVCLFIYPILRIIKNEKIPPKMYFLFKILFYYSAVSILMALFVVLFTGKISLLGENILIKTIKTIILLFSQISFIFVIFSLGSKLPKKYRYKPFYVTYLILFVVGVIELVTMPNAFINLHYIGETPYWRMRLLTSEASFITLMILFFFFTALYYSYIIVNSKIKSIICILIFLFFSVTTKSKSLLVLLLIIVAYVLFQYLKKMTSKKLFFLFFVLVISTISITKIIDSFNYLMGDSFLKSTSFSTRLYSIFIGFITGLIFPFGTGGSSYLYFYPTFLDHFIWIPEHFGFELSEIYSYINASSDSNIAVKSGFFGFFMNYGLVGTIYFFNNYFCLVKGIEKNSFLRPAFYIMFLGIVGFVAIESEFWLTIVLSIFSIDEQRSNETKKIFMEGLYER